MLDLLAGIDAARYRWHVLTDHEAFAAACRQNAVPVSLVQFGQPSLRGMFRLARRAAALIRRYGVSLVHVNNGGACNWALLAAWWCGVPLLVHLHSPLSRRTRFLWGIHFADAIVGVSEAVLTLSRTDPIADNRAWVIHNGFGKLDAVPRDRTAARAPFHLTPQQIVVAIAATLLPWKRVDVAIEALRYLPQDRFVLLVIGDGPELDSLQRQAIGLPVVFAGYRTDVHDLLLNVADLFVLLSEMEAFSIALLEAAAARLPRIGVAAGGTPETILHDVDGLIVPPGDPAAVAEAIVRLADDTALAQSFVEAAYRRLHAELTLDLFLQRFGALYDEMMRQPASRLSRLAAALQSAFYQLRPRRAFHTNA